jgi:hypothetical protein
MLVVFYFMNWARPSALRLLAWKQNIPYLYDSFLQAALPQPCSCMEWLVGKDWEVKMEDWAVSHMVLGTSSRDASEEFNQLLVNWVVRQPDPAAGTAAQDSDSFELPLQPHDPVHTVMAFAHPAGPVSAVSVLPHIPHLAVTKVSEFQEGTLIIQELLPLQNNVPLAATQVLQ